MCQAGCVDPDPSPSAPGVYLGFAVTPGECEFGDYNDLDVDGLGDYCEKRLAEAFAPILRYSAVDDVRRQPYWAARWLDGGKVRLFFAIAYYVDLGVIPSARDGCKAAALMLTWGVTLKECSGHSGDSEHIILDVYYDYNSSHWILDRAQYSFHGSYNDFRRGGNAYPTQLTYVYRGAAPHSWVAIYKHANYKSQADCDAGTGGGVVNLVFDFDSCTGNDSFVAVEAYGNRNLGSNSARLIDCVSAVDPFLQEPPRAPECFWSSPKFYGWQLDRTTDSDGYGSILRAAGFD